MWAQLLGLCCPKLVNSIESGLNSALISVGGNVRSIELKQIVDQGGLWA